MLSADTQIPTHHRRPPHPFDSLAYAKSMESVGFTRLQAERMAEEQAKLIDERLATKEDVFAIQGQIEALRLSTKADIEALHLSTKSDIEALRLSTKSDIDALRLSTASKIDMSAQQTKTELIKWFVGISFTQLATLIAVIKFHV